MQPLPGIKDPLTILAESGLTIPFLAFGGVVGILISLVFIVWFIYTLILAYHWIRYSHASVVAYPALFIHLVVSLACMSYAMP